VLAAFFAQGRERQWVWPPQHGRTRIGGCRGYRHHPDRVPASRKGWDRPCRRSGLAV